MSQESSLPGHHFVEMDLGFPMAHEHLGWGEAVLSCGCSLSRRVAPWARRGQQVGTGRYAHSHLATCSG